MVIPWGMREVSRGEGSSARAMTVLYRPPGLESRPSAANWECAPRPSPLSASRTRGSVAP
eukprot:6214667-Pleurochrysis_carterae.AAC.2